MCWPPQLLVRCTRAPAVEHNRKFACDPFALGMALDYPTPEGIVLWTQLGPEALSFDGGMGAETVAVRWGLARDEDFRDISRRGMAWAEAVWGHSVYVELESLEPARP
jgi:alkaline phosphatase D